LELLNAISYGLIDLVVATWFESDWRVFEQFVTLLIELFLVKANIKFSLVLAI
jgi:hypothetical protein